MTNLRWLGLGLMAAGVLGLSLASMSAPRQQQAAAMKRYTLAINGGDEIDLVERRSGEASAAAAASHTRALVCQRVMRVANVEIGARCREDSTRLAGVGD
ncbi:MAG: hypothetical protein AB7E80_07765 [Hyphomicrobiaceae bacterium]